MKLSFGIQPFWFWNGDMQDEEVARQIREMADKGIKGFFIHPRQGLTVPYLSEEWFRKVGIAVEEAKKHNLEVWLYDEYPYPSGVSGGQVILDHPEFEAKALKRQVLDVEGSQTVEADLPWGQVVLAKAYPVNGEKIDWENGIDLAPYIGTGYRENIFQMSGLTQYNRKRFFTGVPMKKLVWHAPKGQWRVYIFMQVTVDHFKYFEKYVDPLNPNAMAYYIETTHEKYKEHFGHEFGKTIKGIFTDEITAFPGNMPWSPTLPEQFTKANGYSLKDKLPALFEKMGDDTDKVRYDYWNTVTELFINSYEVQVRDWCENNNLLYVGEKPILRSKQLKYFHIPGIDAGHQKVGTEPQIVCPNYRANGKLASSAAHFYNKPGALCECFHSIGWGMTLQDMKWIFDWLAIQGINWFVPHAFFYTTDGLTKHDAPPSSFYQMPYWQHAGLLAEYADKITQIMTGSRRKVNVLVVDPVTSQWTAMGEKREVNNRLKEDFSTLQKILLGHHIDYYIIDPELLGQSSVVDRCIQINDEKFEVLILPPMLNIESDAYSKIKEYIEKGGKVIGTLCLPIEKISSDSNNLETELSHWFNVDAREIYEKYIQNQRMPEENIDLDKGSCCFAGDLSRVPEIIAKMIDRDISIVKDGRQEKDILAALYEKDGRTYCFLANMSGEHHRVNVELKTDGNGFPKLAYLPLGLEGDSSIDYEQVGDKIAFTLDFSPYQSYLLSMEKGEENIQKQPSAPAVSRIKMDVSGDWDFTINRMNVLRLGNWKLKIEGTDAEAEVECQPIVNQVVDASIPLPVKVKDYFGCPREMEFPALKCRYRTDFTLETDTAAMLVMEPGSIEGKWYIEVNGHRIVPEDFEIKEIYLPSNLAVDISGYLKAGTNVIEVYVDTNEVHDGLVNPLYLCGNFSVFKDAANWKITSFTGKGKLDDRIQAGLPFYAGDIEYKKIINLNTDSIGDVLELYIDEPFLEDVVELCINGRFVGTCPWSPYAWRVEKSWLKSGENEVKLRVSTTLLGLFEGQYFNYKEHRYMDV